MSEFTRPRSESFDGAILFDRIGRHADAISSCFVHAQSFILVFTVEHIMDDLRQAWVRAIVYPYWCSKKRFVNLSFRDRMCHTLQVGNIICGGLGPSLAREQDIYAALIAETEHN